MRIAVIALIFPLGCTSTGSIDTDGPATDTDATSDSDATEDTGFTPFATSFESGQFRVTKLGLVADTDEDDDGVVDNNLPNALATVDLLMADYDLSLDTFNLLLQENIDLWVTIVLMDARVDDEDRLTLDLLLGEADEALNLSVDPSSYHDDGEVRTSMHGAFVSEEEFWAGPSEIVIPVTFLPDSDPLPVTLEQARFDGGMTAEATGGKLTAVLPIDELITKVIDPLLDPNGYDINGDGIIETKDQILDLIWSVAPSAGDVDLGGGRTGVSAKFSYAAVPATWSDPAR